MRKLVGKSVAEVERHTVVVVFHVVVELDGYLDEAVVLVGSEVAQLEHVLQHGVAASKAVFGVDAWIVGGGGLEQTYQYGRLLVGEVSRFGVEICLGGGVDAEGV